MRGFNLSRENLTAWFLAFFLCNLFINFNLLSAGDSSLNAYHVLTPFALLIFCLPMTLRKAHLLYAAYFMVLVGTSMAAILGFGFSLRIVLLGFCGAAFLVGFQAPLRLGMVRMDDVFHKVGWIVLGVVVLKTLLFSPVLIHSFGVSRSYIRLHVWMISSGGPNLEVTILAMLALMTMGRKVSLGLMASCGALSVLYQSRAGIIALMVCLAAYYFAGGVRTRTIKLVVAFLGGIIFVVLSFSGLLGKMNILERFTDVQEEVNYGDEGLGRVALYQEAFRTLQTYPLGVGTGNGMRIMQKVTGVEHKENNPHNVYIAIALEGGLQSLLILILIAGRITFFAFFCGFRDRYANAAFIYVLLGMVQFLGYDMPGWIFIGLFEGSLVQRRIERNQEADEEPDLLEVETSEVV